MTAFSDWSNKIVVITGASRGIGRALAKTIAERGAKLGLIARSEADLRTLLDEIKGSGLIQTADVSDATQTQRAIDRITETLGPIDLLINSAGLGAYASFLKTPLSTFENLMKINYLGTVYAMKAVLPAMIQRKKGSIVNIASIAGCIGAPFESAYSASKFAVVGLSEAVRCELKSQGITMTVVCPGAVATSFFETRGQGYTLKSPKLLTEETVVKAILDAIEIDQEWRFIPKWFNLAYILKTCVPKLYQLGIKRLYAAQFRSEYQDKP